MRVLFFSLLLSSTLFGQEEAELRKKIELGIEEIINSKEDVNNRLKRILETVELQKLGKEQVHLEVSLCNYLIEQACILEALDGRGVGLIKKELTENINDHKLSMEDKRFLRRLVELCEETERSFTNVNYIDKDGAEAKADLLVENIGAGVGVSLALGDVTPLITAAVKIGRGYTNINEAQSRQLQILIQAHKARINGFLFNVNSYKNDLMAERGVKANEIITPDVYRSFLQAMIGGEPEGKIKKLEEISQGFAKFKAAQFYLSESYLQSGKIIEAEAILQKMVLEKNPLLHNDGLVSQAYTALSKIYLDKKNYKLCIDFAGKALEENIQNGLALHYRSLAYASSGEYQLAYDDGKKSQLLLHSDAQIAWEVAKIAAIFKPAEYCQWIKKAVENGYNQFSEVESIVKGKLSVEDNWRLKWLIMPKMGAVYKPGILKDDVHLVNVGTFSIEKLKYVIEVRYLKGAKWENFSVEGIADSLPKGGALVVKNNFSMPKDSRCTVKISFTSAQSPQIMEQFFYYNFDGSKTMERDWEFEVKLLREDFLKAIDNKSLKELNEKVLKVNEKSFFQDDKALELLADLQFRLGDKEKAVKFLKMSLEVLTHTDKVRVLQIEKKMKEYQ